MSGFFNAHRNTRHRARVYRRTEDVVLYAAVGVIAIVWSSASFVSLQAQDPVAASLIWLPVALLGVFIMLRPARSGVYVEDGGVRILNPFHTHRLRWEEIDTFSVGAKSFASKIGVVRLRSGEEIALWGLAAPNPMTRPKNRSVENLVGELNSVLREATGAGSAAAQAATRGADG